MSRKLRRAVQKFEGKRGRRLNADDQRILVEIVSQWMLAMEWGKALSDELDRLRAKEGRELLWKHCGGGV